MGLVMPRENVEVVRHAFEAWVAGDGERTLDHFHPDGQLDLSVRGDVQIGARHHDDRKISDSATEWVATWDEYSEKLEEIRDLGDLILVVTTQTGRGKGSGIEISNQYGFLVEVRDGLISRVTGYPNRAAALDAAEKHEQT